MAMVLGVAQYAEAKTVDNKAVVDATILNNSAVPQYQDRRRQDRRRDDRRYDRRDDRRNNGRWDNRGNNRVRYETRIVRSGRKVYRDTYRVSYERGRVKYKRISRTRIN